MDLARLLHAQDARARRTAAARTERIAQQAERQPSEPECMLAGGRHLHFALTYHQRPIGIDRHGHDCRRHLDVHGLFSFGTASASVKNATMAADMPRALLFWDGI